jgi:hypothetical protein
MRRMILIGLSLGGLLLAGCQQSSGGQPLPNGGGSGAGGTGSTNGGSGGTVTASPTAKLTVADPSGATGPFALADLDKLVLSIDGANLSPGAHQLRVDVMSPNGTLYAQLPATLVASQGTGRATSALQVRGSVIESFRESGTWQLVANVDGVPLAAASVDLNE